MASFIGFARHPFELLSTLLGSPLSIPSPLSSPRLVEGIAPNPEVTDKFVGIHGICGWIPDEGVSQASGNWVCQSMGLTMPALVFFVACIVLLVTLLFLIRYFRRFRTVMVELQRLDAHLSTFPRAFGGYWPDIETKEKLLAGFLEAGTRLPPLRAFTQRIEESAISGETLSSFSNSTGKTVLTQPASVLAGGPEGLDSWTGKALADALSGWLTGIGLLTTFLALLLGLQNVHVLSNLEVRGIGGLVNGLSGKFFSSIIALGCATFVSITNYFLSRRVHLLWESILRKADAILPSLSIERIFFEILKRTPSKKDL